MNIYLYSTQACHLCEQAKDILWPLLSSHPFVLREIDIAEDDALIERYGTKIPVLAADNFSKELNWPFDDDQAHHYLAELANSVR